MEKTEKLYKQLSAEERATIMLMQQAGSGLREMGAIPETFPQYHFTRARAGLGCWNRDHFKIAVYFHCGGLDLYPAHVSHGKVAAFEAKWDEDYPAMPKLAAQLGAHHAVL